MATIVTRTRLNVWLYLHCLSYHISVEPLPIVLSNENILCSLCGTNRVVIYKLTADLINGEIQWFQCEQIQCITEYEARGKIIWAAGWMIQTNYRAADKSLVWPTSRCILFDGENISFDASLFICINSTNISPIMIINRIYETQNLLSL